MLTETIREVGSIDVINALTFLNQGKGQKTVFGARRVAGLSLNLTAAPPSHKYLPIRLLDVISARFSSFLATNTACHRKACSSTGKYNICFIEYIGLLAHQATNRNH